jgi:hypothetical protein
LWDFRAWLDSSILRRLCLVFFEEIMTNVLCIFVLDLDSSNAGFGLRFADFGWNPRLFVDHGRISIPLVSVGLMLQIRWDSIS